MFNLVETFFVEVNLEVSNFYQFCHPPPGFYGLALTLAIDCLLINWLLIKRKGVYKILPLFPLLGGMPNASVSFTITCSNNSSTKK